VVVRPPSPVGCVFSLSGPNDHLTVVNHPREALPDQHRGPLGSESRESAIELRRLPSEAIFTCVRCRSNPAVLEAGQLAGALTLVSPDGPICGGCVTKQEQIEMGEAILGGFRQEQPRDEVKIRELEMALADLRDSKPAD
jgi:hypothetical protein